MSAAPEADFHRDEVFTSRFPIHRACRDGDVGALVSLLQQLSHRAPLTAEDSCYGWTPIHWAAHYGQLECVVLLVQMGCEVNTVTSRFNQTPTHTAAFGGHPNCLVWLTQAGADVNKQDFVGEAPVHKAARSGSLECIQVLLIAGAKPHLRNASGQTAADLAQAHGFHDCSRFISNTQKLPPQLADRHGNGRKRPLTAAEAGHMKKARRDVLLQMQSAAAEELDSINMESGQELSSDLDTKAVANGYHHNASNPKQSFCTESDQQGAAAAVRRDLADMCGSLHLTGSSGGVGAPHQSAWWGLPVPDYGDPLHYGHYHGFGDTAEELTDGSSSIHLYHGS